MPFPLVVRAGPEALQRLRQGWDWELFDVVVGASAGPRWLILSSMDRLLVSLLRRRQRPLHLLGSSSGAWRFMAYCQADPRLSLERLEEAYVEANWNHARPLAERGETARQILRAYADVAPVLAQDPFRLHVITAHCRGPLAAESVFLQFLGLLWVGLWSLYNRTFMGRTVGRALFSDPRDPLPAALDDVATRCWPLCPENLTHALLASGSIPLVLPGIFDMPAGPAGCLRDGGLVDYHFDRLHLRPDGLILYPHFADGLAHGWFSHPGYRPRQLDPGITRRLVLVHPHPDWLARLPGGRPPDRQDATRMSETVRKERWWQAVRQGEELGEALAQVERAPLTVLE